MVAPTTSGYNKQLMARETSWCKAGGVVRKKPRPIRVSFTTEDISEFCSEHRAQSLRQPQSSPVFDPQPWHSHELFSVARNQSGPQA